MSESLKLIGIIVRHGRSKEITDILEKHNIKIHFMCQGVGTAPTQLRQLLGLDDTEKDVLFFVCPFNKSMDVIKNIENDYYDKGILFSINLTSVGGQNALNILKGMVV